MAEGTRRGNPEGLQEQKWGPKPHADPRDLELQKLARENAGLVEQLRKPI